MLPLRNCRSALVIFLLIAQWQVAIRFICFLQRIFLGCSGNSFTRDYLRFAAFFWWMFLGMLILISTLIFLSFLIGSQNDSGVWVQVIEGM